MWSPLLLVLVWAGQALGNPFLESVVMWIMVFHIGIMGLFVLMSTESVLEVQRRRRDRGEETLFSWEDAQLFRPAQWAIMIVLLAYGEWMLAVAYGIVFVMSALKVQEVLTEMEFKK